MKIRLWVPAVDDPLWPAALSWLNTEWPEGSEHDFVRSGHGDLATKWNKVVEEFLATDMDWLWSCHTDIEFKPGTLKRLLSWGKPLISAAMFMKAGPVTPHAWEGKVDTGQPGYLVRIRELADWYFQRHIDAIQTGSYIIEPRPGDALYRVNFSSTGCTLIHRKVLEAIEPPWFVADVATTKGAMGGEDRFFCEKALEKDYPMYVDRSCIAGHMPKNESMGLLDFLGWASVLNPRGEHTPMATSNLIGGE